MVRFYVGEITPPQTVKIYTDLRTSVDIEVSEGNKWYSYVLPKDKGLYQIEGDSVKKVVVKADIVSDDNIIPHLTVEASFKGSNTSNVTSMCNMFSSCSGLTSLDLSGWDMRSVTYSNDMFKNCTALTTIRMKGCSEATIKKIEGVKPSSAIIVTE